MMECCQKKCEAGGVDGSITGDGTSSGLVDGDLPVANRVVNCRADGRDVIGRTATADGHGGDEDEDDEGEEPERLVQHANFSLGGWGSGLHHLGCIIMTRIREVAQRGRSREELYRVQRKAELPRPTRVLKLGVHNPSS